MLSVRQLYIAVSTGYVILLFLGMLLVRGLWFYPQEYDQALLFQQSEVSGLLSAMELRREQLEATTHDYASWDDTFRFTHDRDQEYLDSNFLDSTFESLSLAGAIITDNERHILYSATYSKEDGIQENPPAAAQWLTQTAAPEFFSGRVFSQIQLFDGSPHLITSSPVSPSGASDPISGWLIFMQKIDAGYISVLARVSRLNLAMITPPYNEDLPDIIAAVTQLSAVRSVCFYDDAGQRSLCLNIHHASGTGPAMFNSSLIPAFILLCLIPSALFMLVLKLVIDPLRKATELLERNNSDGRLRPVLHSTSIRITELQKLRDAYNELVYIARQQQARLEQLSNTDRLTGLPNRRAFDELLEKTWRRLLRHQQAAALVLVDIDYFKRYNDHYGHQAGDSALRQVAQALRSCAKRTDELASRFGGEEFALILQVEDASDLDSLRKRLSESVRALDIHHDHSPISKQLTISFGIAWIRESGHWLEKMGKEEWLRAADSALYEAKASGRNCNMLQVISPDMPFTESPVLTQSPG